MGRVRDGIAGLRGPLYVLGHLLDRDRPRHGVDHRRLDILTSSVREPDAERDAVPEREILIERELRWRDSGSAQTGDAGGIDERRGTR